MKLHIIYLTICSVCQAAYVSRMALASTRGRPTAFRPGVMLQRPWPHAGHRIMQAASHRAPYVIYRNTHTPPPRFAMKHYNPVSRNVFPFKTTRLPLSATTEYEFVKAASAQPKLHVDGGTGAIHTIPAPNLSLSDKPIVVMETDNSVTSEAPRPTYDVTEKHQDSGFQLQAKIEQPIGFSKATSLTTPELHSIVSNGAALHLSSDLGFSAYALPQQSGPHIVSPQPHVVSESPAPPHLVPQNVLTQTIVPQTIAPQQFSLPGLNTQNMVQAGPDGIVISPDALYQPDPAFMQKLQAQLLQRFPGIEFVPYAAEMQIPLQFPQPNHPQATQLHPLATQFQPHSTQVQTRETQLHPKATQFKPQVQNRATQLHPQTTQFQPQVPHLQNREKQSHPKATQFQKQVQNKFQSETNPFLPLAPELQTRTTQTQSQANQIQSQESQIKTHAIQVQPQSIQVQPQTIQVQAQTIQVQPQTIQEHPQTVQEQQQTIQVQPQTIQVQPQTFQTQTQATEIQQATHVQQNQQQVTQQPLFLLTNERITKLIPSSFVPSDQNRNIVQRETPESNVVTIIPGPSPNVTENPIEISSASDRQNLTVDLVAAESKPTTIKYTIETSTESQNITPIYYAQVSQSVGNVVANGFFSALNEVRAAAAVEQVDRPQEIQSQNNIITTMVNETKAATEGVEKIDKNNTVAEVKTPSLGVPFAKAPEPSTAYTVLRSEEKDPKVTNEGSIYAGQIVEASISEDQEFKKERATLMQRRAPIRLVAVPDTNVVKGNEISNTTPKMLLKTKNPPKSKLTFDDKTGEPVLRIYASYVDTPSQKEQVVSKLGNVKQIKEVTRKQDTVESWKGATVQSVDKTQGFDANQVTQFGLKLRSRSDDYVPLFEDYEE